jgi:hypothetical protein
MKGILLRHASPASPFHENSTPWNFQTGSNKFVEVSTAYANNSVDYQNALNQALLNLNVVALLNTGVSYTGADGKQYTFGYWNDTPLPGTTMAW